MQWGALDYSSAEESTRGRLGIAPAALRGYSVAAPVQMHLSRDGPSARLSQTPAGRLILTPLPSPQAPEEELPNESEPHSSGEV